MQREDDQFPALTEPKTLELNDDKRAKGEKVNHVPSRFREQRL